MKNDLQKLTIEAQNIRMSNTEKRTMRAYLRNATHGELFAAPTPSPVQSPYVYASFFTFQRAVSFALVLVVLAGSTTAYAAQGALPGDVLYAIKTKINEPATGALAFSTEAKANYYASLAERRMEEAQMLAAKGKLDAPTKKILEDSIALHVAATDSETEELSDEDPAAAAEVSARFSSTLSAHSEILAELGDGSKDEGTKEHSESLALYVREKMAARSELKLGGIAVSLKEGNEAETMMLMQDVSLTTSEGASSSVQSATNTTEAMQRTEAGVENAAWQFKHKAQGAFDEARDAYMGSSRKLSASTTADIKVKLSTIKEYLEEGNALIKNGEYTAAQSTFTLALEEAVRLEALINAQMKFDRNILKNLLWDDSRSSGATNSGEVKEEASSTGGINVELSL